MLDATHGLDALLTRERAMLLANAFEGLPTLVDEKAALMRAVAASGADRATLARLSRAAEANGALLEAMARGIRSALRRVREVREGGAGLRTYGANGERQVVPAPGGRLARRA